MTKKQLTNRIDQIVLKALARQALKMNRDPEATFSVVELTMEIHDDVDLLLSEYFKVYNTKKTKGGEENT